MARASFAAGCRRGVVLLVVVLGVCLAGGAAAGEDPGAAGEHVETAEEGVTVNVVGIINDEPFVNNTIELFEAEVPAEYDVAFFDINELDESDIDDTDVFIIYDYVVGPAPADLIEEMEEDTETGVVYLQQGKSASEGSSNGIAARSDVFGDPGGVNATIGETPVSYDIEVDHPLFEGIEGDEVTIHDSGGGSLAWFEDTEIEVLADVADDDRAGGPAAAVTPESGAVLLSSIVVDDNVGLDDHTEEAGQILGNAVEFAEPAPFFAVSDLDAPAQAAPGSEIDVSATITNTGDVTGTQDIDFVLDDETLGTAENVTLDPEQNTTITFEGIPLPEEGGVFEHGVFTADDNQTAEITVGEAFFEVSDLDAPAEAEPGAEIDVSATITNTGDAPGTQDVEFVFDNETAATEENVTLEPGDDTTVEFTPELPDDAGTFEHGVFTADDNQTAEITVGEAFFEVSDLNVPALAERESAIDVTATITNTGDVTGTQDVDFVFDGEVAATVEDVELGVEDDTTVTFEDVGLPDALGVFEHGVFTADDNQTAEITVSADFGDDGQLAQDTTGDGLLNDLTGDGEFTIVDVQVLFENFDGDAIQDNVAAFDFLGDDRVTIFDVQALFNQLQDEG